MVIEFKPIQLDKKSGDFNAWEINDLISEGPVKISEKERLETEKNRLIQEAIEKGYQEGLALAKEQADAKLAELAQWIQLAQNPIQLIDAQLTQELIQTVIWLCEQCIGITLSVNPEKLQALLDEIKTELPSVKGTKSLLMHPQDVAWIKSNIDDTVIPGLQEALVADSSLKRGDFYIKAENSQLDGCLKTRLTTLFGKYIDDSL